MTTAKHFRRATIVALGFATFAFYSTIGGADGGKATYKVTIENLTSGQPFSPPVVATHRSNVRMFRVGRLASPELEAIAEDGNQIPMFDLFRRCQPAPRNISGRLKPRRYTKPRSREWKARR